jgi:hypothetical protein
MEAAVKASIRDVFDHEQRQSETPLNPLLIGGSPLPMFASNYVVSIPHIQND